MNSSENTIVGDFKDKLSSLRQLVRSFELRLRGYVWDAGTTKFIYAGNCLAGEIVIRKAIGLLQPFSEEANLLTDKDRLSIERQIYNVSKAMNNTLIDDEGCPKENYNVIWSMFINTIDNICDIIISSKDAMLKLAGHNEEDNNLNKGMM